MVLILQQATEEDEGKEFFVIVTRATRALEAAGINPDLLTTTNQTRQALEHLFQETVIKSNKAAVRNALEAIVQHKVN